MADRMDMVLENQTYIRDKLDKVHDCVEQHEVRLTKIEGKASLTTKLIVALSSFIPTAAIAIYFLLDHML